MTHDRVRSQGVTLIELLIAIVVISVGLLGLAFVLTSNLRGVRVDGDVTVSNQVATTILEDLRVLIAADNASSRRFDDGETGEMTVKVGSVNRTGTYSVDPMELDASGGRHPATGTPHVFEVSVTVTPRDGHDQAYDAVIVRAR